jgi:trans-aconitate methyltransferase
MNSAQRVLNDHFQNVSDGSAAVAFNRLLFRTAQAAMASSDDPVRPLTATIAYLESLMGPGNVAIDRLRTKYAAQLKAEQQ